MRGDPALAGREATSGTVTWRDTVWPGERLLSSRPVGNSWTDHGWAPFARCAALGAAFIGIQHQAIWRASIVRPGPTGAIGRPTELCTEFAAVFRGETAPSACLWCKRQRGAHPSTRKRLQASVPQSTEAPWWQGNRGRPVDEVERSAEQSDRVR
jgi:hypothetical protein